jgi:hypothetical protein
VEQQLILDRYRPLEDLGHGGFATVTLAWDTRMQRRVAIKRLDLPRDHKSGAIIHDPRGLAEARTAAMLNHPSIVTVYDFATDADEAFIIMEYVDGASLERVLDDISGALTVEETAAVVEAVSSALTFAHDNGVLHLDVKPANVLVTRDGRVKVVDFGMAELSTATGHGASFGGTVGYMPLEQLEGMRVSEAADEWALATLAFECLTGSNPFDAEDTPSAITLLETLDPPLPSSFEQALPPAIDDILFAGTGLRPADRYPSVKEFAAALLPHLGDAVLGRESLAGLVEAYADDTELPEEPGFNHVGLWDRMRGVSGAFALRSVAAAESAWLAWAGLAPTHLQPLPLAGAAALVALAAALAPSLGTGLGLVAFAVGLFARQMWVLGSLFSAAAITWWWFAARRHPNAAVLPLAAPLLGTAHIPFVMPLLAGFTLPPLSATIAGFAGGLLQLLASSASDQSAPYVAVAPELLADPSRAAHSAAAIQAAFLDPSAWVALLGWPLAAFLMSVACRRATRLSALLGAVLGAGALLGMNVLARLLADITGAGSATDWIEMTFVASLGGSLILVVLVAVLGAPVRSEEEGLIHPAWQAAE